MYRPDATEGEARRGAQPVEGEELTTVAGPPTAGGPVGFAAGTVDFLGPQHPTPDATGALCLAAGAAAGFAAAAGAGCGAGTAEGFAAAATAGAGAATAGAAVVAGAGAAVALDAGAGAAAAAGAADAELIAELRLPRQLERWTQQKTPKFRNRPEYAQNPVCYHLRQRDSSSDSVLQSLD